MECDIHIVVEMRNKLYGKWIGIYTTDVLPGGRPKIAGRDYGFFAEVAGVRGTPSKTENYPRFLPVDVSDLAWDQFMRYPTDHHSPSHMTVEEFVDAYRAANEKNGYAKEKIGDGDIAIYDLLGIDTEYGDYDYRVVFWFDN